MSAQIIAADYHPDKQPEIRAGKLAMPDFFRFPSSTQLAWLTKDGIPSDDKMFSPAEAQALLSSDGVDEEMHGGLSTVPRVSIDRTTLAAPKQLVMDTHSRYRAVQPLEGVVVRRESIDWCEARAKLVHPDFVQAIDTHWRKRAIEWNRVDWTQT